MAVITHLPRFGWTSLVGFAFLIILGTGTVARAQTLSVSPPAVTFGVQNIGTSSAPKTVTLTNTGPTIATLANIVLSGTFYGDFVQANNCPAVLAAGAACSITLTFSPTGTGPRTATLLVLGDRGTRLQSVALAGTGMAVCPTISDCTYRLLNQRVAANRNDFYVYQDADSAFNHGFPSGLFGTIDLKKVSLDSGCVDDPASPTGCSADLARLDGTGGTVFRFNYPALSGAGFVGLSWQDPENFNGQPTFGSGYDLTPATSVQFDARSPDGAKVQFGVGGCVTGFYQLGQSLPTITISIADVIPPPGPSNARCTTDLTNSLFIFPVATHAFMSP